jgi:hypothetical protein
MGKEASFTPKIVTWACTSCDAEFKRKECLSNGRYCAMNHKGTYIMGKDILIEDLREKCLWDIVSKDGKQDQWWQYIQYVHRMCYEEINENCSKLGHKSIGRSYDETMKCVKTSFDTTSSTDPNYSKDENRLLKADSEKWKALGSAYWPTIVINERTFRGDMVPDTVMTALCSSFNSEPSYCSQFREEIGTPIAGTGSGVTRSVLVMIVIFLVVLNVLIILLYRRCQNRELKQNMQLQVNSAVS